MPTKKNAKKKAPTKTVTKKKTAVAKKVAAKKVAKKVAAKKVAKKAAAKPTAQKKTAKTTAKTTAIEKPKASDFIKRAAHTPAIFKPNSRRPVHILFSIDDVRVLIKKRAKEEKEELAAQAAQAAKAAKAAKAAPAQPIKGILSKEEELQIKNSKHHAASLDDILGLSSPVRTAKGATGEVPKKFKKYYNLLIQLRDHVRAELNLHSKETLKKSPKEDTGDISISVDAGTDNFDRDFALSLLSSEQESLKEIEAAIERVFDGTYGICEVTGEPINADRLEAVPFTRFSLEGQRQHELTSRKRVSRAGAYLNEASGETISFGDDDGDN